MFSLHGPIRRQYADGRGRGRRRGSLEEEGHLTKTCNAAVSVTTMPAPVTAALAISGIHVGDIYSRSSLRCRVGSDGGVAGARYRSSSRRDRRANAVVLASYGRGAGSRQTVRRHIVKSLKPFRKAILEERIHWGIGFSINKYDKGTRAFPSSRTHTRGGV